MINNNSHTDVITLAIKQINAILETDPLPALMSIQKLERIAAIYDFASEYVNNDERVDIICANINVDIDYVFTKLSYSD